MNGCSEMATTLVTGMITLVFNWTMLRYAGEDGVAAGTIIMHVLMLASSLYTGYTYGVAPMISYHDGEQNHEKLKKLIRISLYVISVVTVATGVVSLMATKPLASIFTQANSLVYQLAVAGNNICSLALLFI